MGTRQTPLNVSILIVGVLGVLLAVAPIGLLLSAVPLGRRAADEQEPLLTNA